MNGLFRQNMIFSFSTLGAARGEKRPGHLKTKEGAAMSVVKIPDGSGNTMTVLDLDGERYPTFPVEVIKGVPNLKLRDDDILLCGYPKSVDYGSWFDHMESWSRGLRTHPDIPTFIVHYEDLLQNPVSRLKELSTFLGQTHGDSFIEEVKEWCSFESMRSRKGKHDLSRDGEPIMYRKGKVGNWKEWFTVTQNEWFDKVLQERMKDINVKFTYS